MDNEELLKLIAETSRNGTLDDRTKYWALAALYTASTTYTNASFSTATALEHSNDVWEAESFMPSFISFIPKKQKMTIDPKEFKYRSYLNEYCCPISEDDARERMTNYHYRTFDPLLITELDTLYYFPGPDEETNPIRKKFYDKYKWYRNSYRGKHGQKSRLIIEKQYDISEQIWQDLVIAMVVSGDYTLREALYIVAVACDRCRNVLLYKYRELHNHVGSGYPEDSPEFQNSNERCLFCRY